MRKHISQHLIWASALILFVSGCQDVRRGAKTPRSTPAANAIEAALVASYAVELDLVAQELDSIAAKIESGDLKYDTKIMDAYADAFDVAASKASEVLAKAVADSMNDGSATVDPANAKKVATEMAAAARKLSSKIAPKPATKASQ